MQDGSKQCTISVLDDDGHNLRLRGDILMKCYHRNQEFAKSGRDSRTGRECIFACQFHTCAINDSSCLFTRSDLDSAFVGKFWLLFLFRHFSKLTLIIFSYP